MELHLDAYIYLKGKLNGVETDIVLDSGAGATVVDAAFADGLGLKQRGSVVAKGVGGRQDASFLEDIRIEVGAVTFEMPNAVRIDMSSVGQRAGRAMPLILGREVFRDLVIDLDYPASRCALHEPGSFKYAGPGKTVPLYEAEQGVRAIDVLIEGLGPARARVDTGSGNTIDLFPAFVGKHKLLEGRSPVSSRRGGGVGGALTLTVGTLRSLTIAGFELKNLPGTFVGETNRGAYEALDTDGNMGAGVFSRFRLVFDYSRDQLHVEPGPDYATRPFRKDRIGLQVLLKDGLLEVSHVSPGSPAAKAGLKAGALIKAVNGQPVRAEGWRSEALRWSTSPAGTEVAIIDADGNAHKLIAADYY
jgi:membrane-associated protease RseP (regulator of RpoE activity)